MSSPVQGAGHIGDYDVSTVLDFKFNTQQFLSGAPFALAGGSIGIYKNNMLTGTTSGVTLTADWDSKTGANHVRVDLSTALSYYAAGAHYNAVIEAGTVNGLSVVGKIVGSFTLRKDSALKPTTAGRTLDVSSTGEAGIDWANIGSPTTVVGLSGTTILTASNIETDTQDIQNRLPSALGANGNIKADVRDYAGVAATTSGGRPEVNLSHIAGTGVNTASAQLGVNIVNAGGSAITSASGIMAVNVTKWAGQNTSVSSGNRPNVHVAAIGDVDAVTAANNLGNFFASSGGWDTVNNIRNMFDGDGYAGGTTKLSVNVASGGLNSGAFVTGAITAKAIATDAIGAAKLAQDAVTEIVDGLLKRDMSAVTGESARSPLNALRLLMNKRTVVGSTLTVCKEDDSTSAWTATVTQSGSATPITAVDPA